MLLTVDGFIFVGTGFCGLNKNDTFVGFKIRGHSIFFDNSYRKLSFHGYLNCWIRSSTKTTKIGTPRNLRRCKTAITWLQSLSAILPLFWRRDFAELHRLWREDSRNVLWRHEICDVSPRIMTCALQNMQFSHYFTTKFNLFSLNLTGESNFLYARLQTGRIMVWWCPSGSPSVRPSDSPSVRSPSAHFPHFSPTCFDILSWNFAHDFVWMYYRSSSTVVTLRPYLKELCLFVNLE